MKKRVRIEGMMPYRALNRLRREGISVEKAEICQKNAVEFSVDAKDIVKIFAIYPNMCYNGGRGAGYSAVVLPPVGWQKTLERLKKRTGLFVGGMVFLLLTALSDLFVLRIEVVGETAYESAVTEILGRNEIRVFEKFPNGKTDVVTAEILRLDGVGFCSVQKVGSTVLVEVRTFPFVMGENEGEVRTFPFAMGENEDNG